MSTLNETNIKATADAMVELGLVELGYNYCAWPHAACQQNVLPAVCPHHALRDYCTWPLVNLDDCWATGRDKDGRLIADPKLWTDGTLKHIADYVHSKGMLFGTYTDRGTYTCAKRPGAQGHEALDAATYASWGVE